MDKAWFERIDLSWKKHVLRSLDPFWTNYYSLLDQADFENGLRFVVIKRCNSPDKGCDGEVHLPCRALMSRSVLSFAKPDAISNCRFMCLHATHSFHLWLVLGPRSFTVEWKSAIFQPTFSFLRDVMHALHFYIHCTGYLVLWHEERAAHMYTLWRKKGQLQLQRLCKQNIFCILFFLCFQICMSKSMRYTMQACVFNLDKFEHSFWNAVIIVTCEILQS